jgi:hypothetical protein
MLTGPVRGTPIRSLDLLALRCGTPSGAVKTGLKIVKVASRDVPSFPGKSSGYADGEQVYFGAA